MRGGVQHVRAEGAADPQQFLGLLLQPGVHSGRQAQTRHGADVPAGRLLGGEDGMGALGVAAGGVRERVGEQVQHALLPCSCGWLLLARPLRDGRLRRRMPALGERRR